MSVPRPNAYININGTVSHKRDHEVIRKINFKPSDIVIETTSAGHYTTLEHLLETYHRYQEIHNVVIHG